MTTIKSEGAYTTLEDQGEGKLRITLTEQGKAELRAYVQDASCNESCGSCGADIGESTVFVWHEANEDCRAVRDPVEVHFTKPHDQILVALLEDHLSRLWGMPEPWQVGALTSSPILAYAFGYDMEGYVTKAQAVYWFPKGIISLTPVLVQVNKTEGNTRYVLDSRTDLG